MSSCVKTLIEDQIEAADQHQRRFTNTFIRVSLVLPLRPAAGPESQTQRHLSFTSRLSSQTLPHQNDIFSDGQIRRKLTLFRSCVCLRRSGKTSHCIAADVTSQPDEPTFQRIYKEQGSKTLLHLSARRSQLTQRKWQEFIVRWVTNQQQTK